MKKVKKILFSIGFLMILICSCEVKAYSNKNFSIDIPSSYTKSTNGEFTASNEEHFIDIYIEDIESLYNNVKYDKRNLDILMNYLSENAEELLQTELKKVLNAYYGNFLTGYQINQFAKKCEYNVINGEITKISKNNYKCFHITSSMYILNQNFYIEQFAIISGTQQYVITIISISPNVLEESQIKSIINSFTIKNFKDIENNTLEILTLITVIILFIYFIFYSIAKHDKIKKSEETTNNYNFDDYNIRL